MLRRAALIWQTTRKLARTLMTTFYLRVHCLPAPVHHSCSLPRLTYRLNPQTVMLSHQKWHWLLIQPHGSTQSDHVVSVMQDDPPSRL
ncbi:hypothetical protein L210DRAFT_3520252, partial [Boletus edulis BED1]